MTIRAYGFFKISKLEQNWRLQQLASKIFAQILYNGMAKRNRRIREDIFE